MTLITGTIRCMNKRKPVRFRMGALPTETETRHEEMDFLVQAIQLAPSFRY